MHNAITFLKFIFRTCIIFLIILSVFPGSLLGLVLYQDLGRELNVIKNPFGTAINHFISYFCVATLGFFIYLRTENFKKLVQGMLLLSIILEIIQLIIPHRAFQISDLIANFSGVLAAYFLVKIYLFFDKHE